MNSIFGSTLSLDGLLDDQIFNDVGDEEFLRDLGPVQPSSFGGLGFEKQANTQPCQTSSHTSSYSGVGYDASSDTAETFPSTASLPVASGLQLPQEWPVSAPMMQTTPSYGTCATNSQPQSQAQDNAALLTQLLTTLHASSQQPALKQEPFNNMSISEAQPQPGPAQPAVNVTLPSLNAEQQLALQSIMSLGSLGSTPEGKKVKRMLSNRESARRSRHRKQAHMQELEDRVHGIESENESLKLTLARFNEQDMRHKAEKMQLTAENAALRSRIMQLEQGVPCSPFSLMAADATRGGSFESCCASGIKRNLPDAASFEDASKRIRC